MPDATTDDFPRRKAATAARGRLREMIAGESFVVSEPGNPWAIFDRTCPSSCGLFENGQIFCPPARAAEPGVAGQASSPPFVCQFGSRPQAPELRKDLFLLRKD
jgi:hypothetical protein